MKFSLPNPLPCKNVPLQMSICQGDGVVCYLVKRQRYAFQRISMFVGMFCEGMRYLAPKIQTLL